MTKWVRDLHTKPPRRDVGVFDHNLAGNKLGTRPAQGTSVAESLCCTESKFSG
jgi:hypothetical protein